MRHGRDLTVIKKPCRIIKKLRLLLLLLLLKKKERERIPRKVQSLKAHYN